MTGHTRRNVLRGTAAVALAGGAGALLGGRAAAMAPAASATAGGSPFSEGAFTPATRELTAFSLPVTGRLPRELNGRYLRNGPNALGIEDPRAHHWMIGPGMVHGVRLRDGRAEWYRNRWVRSAAVAQQLGEPYRGKAPEDDFACNTHVVPYKGRILALQEGGPLPYELDGELNTVRPYDFRGTHSGSFAAHTKYDAHADELHAIAYYPTWDHVRHVVVDRTGRVTRTTRIAMPAGSMVHDFGLTERHIVVIDIPISFDAEAARNGAIVPYVWDEHHTARVGVMPRAGGPVRWFEVDPVYYSHTLNAYDEGATVVMDLTTYPAPFFVAGRGSGGPAATGTPALDRWTIDLEHGRVHQRRIDDRPQEFPRVNEAMVSRRHRYGYSAAAAEFFAAYESVDGVPPDRAFSSALIKQDLLRGTSQVHRLPKAAAAGEPVFVPRAAGDRHAAEDDGYALAYVHNPERGASDLVILDARDFTAAPVARVHLPGRVPLGFHGSWVPDA
ncbi:carotenoid oxygenase family protein [Streptomyces sp. NPDC001205]